MSFYNYTKKKDFYFTDLKKLLNFLNFKQNQLKKIDLSSVYPLKITHHLAQKIQKNNFTDPLFLQFIPLKEELKKNRGFGLDPVQDSCFCRGNLLQKYQNRALLLCTESCFLHCRFCFRRHFLPSKTVSVFKSKNFVFELGEIQKNKNLTEIILSGGDPLTLSNPTLKRIFSDLENISHIKRIRIHTRAITACPERIDSVLLSIFAKLKKPLYFVTHINHPNEIDQKTLQAITKLKKTKTVILNQTVLLKNINDNLSVLYSLAEKLANAGVLFYYLHQLDQVQGAFHFKVKKEKGLQLIKQLRTKTSGYAVPQYVQEIPFEKHKTVLI